LDMKEVCREVARDKPGNDEIAETLERVAELLEAQDANPFRVRAYRRAAENVREADEPVARRARSDDGRLEEIPGVGGGIAGSIRELVRSGNLRLLERLEGETGPEELLGTVPGVGKELARRIHEELEIDSLEELEQAAYDGRLEGISGFGQRRVRGIRDALDSMLTRAGRRRARSARARERSAEGGEEKGPPAPPVELILEVDSEYRRKAEKGKLRKIAQKVQPGRKSVAPDLPHRSGGMAFHGALLQHVARPRAR